MKPIQDPTNQLVDDFYENHLEQKHKFIKSLAEEDKLSAIKSFHAKLDYNNHF